VLSPINLVTGLFKFWWLDNNMPVISGGARQKCPGEPQRTSNILYIVTIPLGKKMSTVILVVVVAKK
jgi:hypothetical protein